MVAVSQHMEAETNGCIFADVILECMILNENV